MWLYLLVNILILGHSANHVSLKIFGNKLLSTIIAYYAGRFSAHFFVYSSAFFMNLLRSLVYSSARSPLSGCSGSGSWTNATNAWITAKYSQVCVHVYVCVCVCNNFYKVWAIQCVLIRNCKVEIVWERKKGGRERDGERTKERERERGRRRKNEREREEGSRTEIKSFCVPWSVFVAGFQFSGLMMGRHTCPFSSMLGW